jgi:GT2 family glycosyltransferase
MTLSRNIGLFHAHGDIAAMIDDDAYAEPQWLQNVLETFATDPRIGGVGGRAINSTPEPDVPIDQIGRIWPNGCLAANFHVDSGQPIEVDHIIGCNMSFRRDVLMKLGGLRDDFPGTEVGEDTDISLRVHKLGYKLMFNPAACVFHVGAPHVIGRRFGLRYEYYHRHNNFILLLRNFGPGPIVWRYLARTSFLAIREAIRKTGNAVLRLLANFAGAATGIARGCLLILRDGRDPIRRRPIALPPGVHPGEDGALPEDEPRVMQTKSFPGSNQPEERGEDGEPTLSRPLSIP